MGLKQLRRRRQTEGRSQWTQKGVAQQLGVSLSTYQKYEKNPETMTVKTQNQLADVFGVAPEEITK